MVSNFYREGRMLNFHVLNGREILYLVVYDLGVFQVWLDVLSLEKFKNFTSFLFVPLFGVSFSRFS